jgi:membrane fusion protein (multidrug efflux system)/multidrug efflux system membrane fusion protein
MSAPSHKSIVVGAVVAALALAAALLAKAGGGAAEPAPARRTRVGSTAAPPSPPPPTFIGVVRTGDAVEVAPKVEVKLDQVLFRAGDRVRRGQPLASLDVHALESDLAIARAEEAEARARLRDAAARLRRRRALGRTSIAREELDEADAQAAMARAQMEAHRARAVQLARALDDARLRAPFDGVVAALYASPGALVSPTRPVLRLIGDGAVEVRFAVPERQAASVTAGQPVHIELSALGLSLRGTVERIAPEVDAVSHLVVAVARVNESQNPGLVSGTVARVTPAPADKAERAADPHPRSGTEATAPAAAPAHGDGSRAGTTSAPSAAGAGERHAQTKSSFGSRASARRERRSSQPRLRP